MSAATRVARVLGCVLMATCLVAFAGASAAVAAPCTASPAAGGEWPSYGHDAANTRTQPDATGFGPSAVTGNDAEVVFLDEFHR